MSFMDNLRKDISYLKSIDDEIDDWHENDHKVSLQTFLGMTDKEFQIFVSGNQHFEKYVKENICPLK